MSRIGRMPITVPSGVTVSIDGQDVAVPDDKMPPTGLAPDEIPLKIDKSCPGDPGCEDGLDDTLYVDGGTTANILVNADMRSPKSVMNTWRVSHPNVPLPKIRYWVVINNQLGAAPQVVQPTWVSITGASVSTAIRSSSTRRRLPTR